MKITKLLISLLFVGCSFNYNGTPGEDGYSIVMIDRPATACGNGGSRLLFGLDLNRNGVYDSSDTPVREITVCNGASAAVTALPLGDTNCPTGGVSVSVEGHTSHICNGNVGPAGPSGKDAETIQISSVKVTAACGYVNGIGTEGVWVRFWVDRNENGWINDGEVLSSYTVCNGANVSLTEASESECPAGGVKLSVPGSTKTVCDPNVTPSNKAIKLCPGDNKKFPEYGLVVDGELYAVYYGDVGGKLQGFMTQLVNGSYSTTNGDPACTFKYENDGVEITLSNSNGTFTHLL